MEKHFPLLIGLLVMVAIYISLWNFFRSMKRAIGVFAAICGIVTMLWLQDNPYAIEKYSAQIAVGGLTVVLALLALAKRVSK